MKINDNISLLNPEWFFLLVLLIPMIIFYILKWKKETAVVKYSHDFKDSDWRTWKSKLKHLPFFVQIIGLILLTIAMTRPQSSISWNEQEIEGIDIVLSLDLSTSMLARDFKPNRFESAKKIAMEFADGRVNDRLGLVVYAGESFTQSPITSDISVVKNVLSELELGWLQDGTAIGDGLATAVKRLKDSQAESKVVILLTDGENNTGKISPSTAAELAKTFGIRVYTIGVGTTGNAEVPYSRDMFSGSIIYKKMPVKIDEETLIQIADITNGQYYRATNEASLREIYKEIDLLEKSKISSTEFQEKTELFHDWLLMGMILIALAYASRLTVFKLLN
ncbi:VWA domain-containing protein [Flavobacteriales bacterium]|nr:VWA domain-containing protein [Flavobacteriales bacterium]